jgi:hypothetical protein
MENRNINQLKQRHLNQYELGQHWHLSPRTLERWRWEGFGPPHLKIGGRILYRIEDIEAYEEKFLRNETGKHPGVPIEDAA